MLIFKILSVGTGAILTVTSIYVAQRKVNQYCQEDEVLESSSIGLRMLTCFATSVLVGGGVSKVINSVFNHR